VTKTGRRKPETSGSTSSEKEPPPDGCEVAADVAVGGTVVGAFVEVGGVDVGARVAVFGTGVGAAVDAAVTSDDAPVGEGTAVSSAVAG
jgi:hypothetical protein